MTSLAKQRSLISEKTKYVRLADGVTLESGEHIPEVEVAYRTWGELNPEATNTVLICHALTGSADADDWWQGMFGPGKALNPERDFIVCSNVLGGCYGTTGPLSQNPSTGTHYGADFPRVTIRDMVSVQRRLLAEIGVPALSLVIGPSLGGMQVLEWAACFPELVQKIAPIGVSGRHSAWCIATSEAQRQAIYADPEWQDGHYSLDSPPRQGFAVARMMAMVSYRSWQNFEQRFSRNSRQPAGESLFEVESYLRYQGEKIHHRFDAVSYVRLTQAMDSHDLSRARGNYAQVLAQIEQPALVVSVESDVLYPPLEQQELAQLLTSSSYAVLESANGHDGFLIDTDELGALVREFRDSPLELSAKALAVGT